MDLSKTVLYFFNAFRAMIFAVVMVVIVTFFCCPGIRSNILTWDHDNRDKIVARYSISKEWQKIIKQKDPNLF